MTAKIELAVTGDLADISQDEYDSCAPRFNDPVYTGDFFTNPANSLNCESIGVQSLTSGNSDLLSHGKSCSTGYVVENVGGTDKCGR